MSVRTHYRYLDLQCYYKFQLEALILECKKYKSTIKLLVFQKKFAQTSS